MLARATILAPRADLHRSPMPSGDPMTRTPTGDVWTYAEYARLPDDGNRYEVIDGEVLVTPAPGTLHQHIAANLFMAVRQYVEQHGLGIALWDVDLLFVEGQFLRPDFLVVPAAGRAGITDRGVETAPALVVEVLSPSSRSIDLVKKPRRYRDFGVGEYWVAEPGDKVLSRFAFADGRREAERIAGQLMWQPEAGVAPLEIDLTQAFTPF
jgi:Uma2 family endonuclease